MAQDIYGELAALRQSHEILRRSVERSIGRAILAERKRTEAEMDRRLQTGSLTGRQWPTRSRQPNQPSLETPLLDRMNDVVSEGQGWGAVEEEPGVAFYDLLVNHLPNATFGQHPPIPDDAISNINPLPGRWELVRTGTAIVAFWREGSASGGYVELSMSAGAAGDELLFERIIRVPPSTLNHRPAGIYVVTENSAASEPFDTQLRIKAQYMTADAVTLTGTEDSINASLWVVDVGNTFTVYPNDGITPDDAAYVRIRVGLSRAASTTAATAVLFLYAVGIVYAQYETLVASQHHPLGIEPPGRLKKEGGQSTWQHDITAPEPYIGQEDDYTIIETDDPGAIELRAKSTSGAQGGYIRANADRGLWLVPLASSPLVDPGHFAIYALSDGHVYGQDEAGNEYQLDSGGGASRAFSWFTGG